MKIERGDLPIGYPECRGKYIAYPAYVEAKFDGELGIFVAAEKKVYGKGGKIRSGFPVTDLLTTVAKSLGCNYIFGELYWDNGYAGQLYDLASNYDSDDLKFCIFDFDSEDPYEMRRVALIGTAPTKPYNNLVHVVPADYVTDKVEFDESFKKFTDMGYEGVVVKQPGVRLVLGHNAWVKVKKKETADLKVMSFEPLKERIGLQNPFNRFELCGVKVPGTSPIERESMVGKIVEIEYLQKLYDKNGTLTGLRNPIFKRVRADKNLPNL